MNFFFVGERLAIDLLNTVLVQEGRVRDLLETRHDVAAWAAAAGIVGRGDVDSGAPGLASEPGGLRGFRETLRRGLLGWAGTRRLDRRLIALLNRHLARDPEVAEVGVEGSRVMVRRRSTGEPRDRLYGAVARSAAELLARGDPRRFRKCANPACRLMFYDVSKAGRRRWCSMRACGARAKVRAFRERLKPPSPAAPR